MDPMKQLAKVTRQAQDKIGSEVKAILNRVFREVRQTGMAGVDEVVHVEAGFAPLSYYLIIHWHGFSTPHDSEIKRVLRKAGFAVHTMGQEQGAGRYDTIFTAVGDAQPYTIHYEAE